MLKEDIENVSSDTQNASSDTQNASSDTQNELSDTQNASSDTQNVSSDTQNVSSDTQNELSDTQSVLSDTQIQFNIQELNRMVLEFCVEPRTAKEIREHINITSKRYVAYEIIKPLVEKGLLDFTNKKNINARNQKYITIDKRF